MSSDNKNSAGPTVSILETVGGPEVVSSKMETPTAAAQEVAQANGIVELLSALRKMDCEGHLPEELQDKWDCLDLSDVPSEYGGDAPRDASTPAAPGIDLEQFRDLADFALRNAKFHNCWERRESLARQFIALIDASPKGGSDEPNIPEPSQECYSDDGGDSWHDHPADADLVDGLAVGDTYPLTVSHYSVERTYRVTKAPDETSDDYEVEPVQATSAEAGA